MLLDRFIKPYIFIITFFISLVIVYFMHPEPLIVYRFPNPENAGKLTYKNSNAKEGEQCYKYEASEVKCPSDPNLILEHPLIIH